MNNDKIIELINKKKDKLVTTEDWEKYEFILEVIKDKNCFFNIPIEITFGILEFLDVNKDDALGLYCDLISPQKYRDNIPKERIIIEPKIQK